MLPRRRGIDWRPYALIAPVVLLLVAISIYPSVYAVWLAMAEDKIPPYWQETLREKITVKEFHIQGAKLLRGQA